MRHFLNLIDLSSEEIETLLEDAVRLKAGESASHLRGG